MADIAPTVGLIIAGFVASLGLFFTDWRLIALEYATNQFDKLAQIGAREGLRKMGSLDR